MKILFLITGLAYGGAETETVNLAIGLKKRGFDIGLISIMTPIAFVEDLENSGIRLYTLDIKKKVSLLFNFTKIFKILSQEKPDLVHAQMYHANVFSRLIYFFSRANYCLINSIQNNYEGGFFRKSAYKITKGIPDLVSHVSKIGLKNYIEAGLIKEQSAIFVPNSVNISASDNITPFDFKESFQTKDNKFVFLAVARLERQKDYPGLFKAVDILRHASDKSFIVFIAGKGTLDNELKSLTKKMELENHIHFMGLRRDIPMLMKGADCFVMSSEWEGTPLSLLEAMGAGLPTVVTDAGDNRFIIQDGINGFISPISDPAKLAENMKKMLELSGSQLADMGHQSKVIASDNFDREVIIDKWITIYQQCLLQ